jgi:hypothetical protein
VTRAPGHLRRAVPRDGRSGRFSLVYCASPATDNVITVWDTSHLLTYISLLTWITGLFVCSHRYGPSGVRSVQVEYNSRSSRHLDVTIERLLLVCRVLYQITYYSHLDPLHQHLIRPATG